MKIRARLSLWYASVTFFILLLFSLATYVGMRHLLYRALDEERDLIAKNIESSYDPQTQSFRNLQAPRYRVSHRMQESYFVVYNSYEQPVYRSPTADQLSLPIPLTHKRTETTTIVRTRHTGITFYTAVEDSDITFQAASRQLFYKNRQIGWVNIAAPISDIQESMHNLLRILLSGVLAVGLLVGGGTYFLTDKALSPVAAITDKARRISSTNLSERIDVENKEDELGRLSQVLNELLDRLQRAFESQRQFMADAAHELNTPLAILRTHWEDELNNLELPQPVKEKLVHDVETISRLNRLINHLLLLSRTEGMALAIEKKPLPLAELVWEVVADAGVLADMKEQKLEVGNLSPVQVAGSRDRLYQLLFNLVDNAVKYTQPGGSISVSLGERGGQAIFSVRDTGPGIPQEHAPHIFDRFYRVNKDRSRKTGGSGLGLSICKLIAEAHGGQVEVSSTPGKGSEFIVKLPLAPVREASTQA